MRPARSSQNHRVTNKVTIGIFGNLPSFPVVFFRKQGYFSH
jgi:hypothetical protein